MKYSGKMKCEECGDDVKKRTRCTRCCKLLCRYCFHHFFHVRNDETKRHDNHEPCSQKGITMINRSKPTPGCMKLMSRSFQSLMLDPKGYGQIERFIPSGDIVTSIVFDRALPPDTLWTLQMRHPRMGHLHITPRLKPNSMLDFLAECNLDCRDAYPIDLILNVEPDHDFKSDGGAHEYKFLIDVIHFRVIPFTNPYNKSR